jgi:para-aminobenzoate synthetase
MTGAPKIRTVSIIDRLEGRTRGPYSGALGFLTYGNRMDLSMVIRTIVMAGTNISVASGGAIVALSDPMDEFNEMLLKARAPLRALALASAGDSDAWEMRHASP